MKDAVQHYRNLYKIEAPVTVTDIDRWEADDDTSYYFKDGTVIFRDDSDELRMLPYLFAELKLGTGGHPLLSWPRFQAEYSENDFDSINLFATLVTPLREAWIYRIMKHFLTAEEFEREMEDFKSEAGVVRRAVEENMDDADIYRLILSLLTYEVVLYSLGDRENVQFPHHPHMVPEERLIMDQYVEGLKVYAGRDPSVELYVNLANALGLNFSVNIRELPYPHFEVKSKGDDEEPVAKK